MLLNYSFTDYGLFKEPALLSMQPNGKISRYEDNEVDFGNGIRALKSAVIVGENGGGKTTIAKSMQTLKNLVSTSNQVLKAPLGLVNANLRHDPEAQQEYELEAVITIGEKSYIYHFILMLDGQGIVRESLSRRKALKQKEEAIYSAGRAEGAKLNPKYFSKIKPLEKSIKEFQMGAVLTRVVGFCPEVIAPFVEWLRDSLVVKCTEFADLAIYQAAFKPDEQSLSILKSDSFFELFRLVDSSIVDIEIDEKDPYNATKIIRMDDTDEEYSVQLIDESTGIREFFCWSEQIWKILYENKTVFADEVDRVLNPVLASRLVAYINNSKHKGQFIFTTHNALHLNFDDFRKEQMWIVSKGKEPLTAELYSVADFRGIRYSNKHLYEAYLSGFLGGIGNA